MKKALFSFIIPLTIFAFAVVVIGPVNAQAQTTVCPAGYTCIPTLPCPTGYTCVATTAQPADCPAGYFCKYTNTTPEISPVACSQFNTNIGSSNDSMTTPASTSGADVVALQKILIAKGYTVSSATGLQVADGIFGPLTRAAVIKYQASKGLPSTGFVGPLTRVALNAECSSSNSFTVASVGVLYSLVKIPYVELNTGKNGQISIIPIFNLAASAHGSAFNIKRIIVSLGTNKKILTNNLQLFVTDGKGNVLSSVSLNSSTVTQQLDGSYSVSMSVNLPVDKNSIKNFAVAVDNLATEMFVTGVSIPKDGIRAEDSNGLSYSVPDQAIYASLYSSPTPTPTSSAQPSVKVTYPNGGETFRIGDVINVTWKASNFTNNDVTKIYLAKEDNLGSRTPISYEVLTTVAANAGSQAIVLGKNISNQPLFVGRGGIPSDKRYKIMIEIGSSITQGSKFATGESRDTFSIVSDNQSSSITPILNSSNGYKPTGTLASDVSITASLTSVNEDRVGAWENFGAGKAYINQNPADFGFTLNMSLGQTARSIKAITIFYNYSGQGCSTSRDLATFGVDPYPMVMLREGVQVNRGYDVGLGSFEPRTSYSLKLYCQPESTPFNGGKILVTFTDGTYAYGTIAANTLTSALPSLVQPSISYLSQSSGLPGTKVTIYGKDFCQTANNVVTFTNATHDTGDPNPITSSDGKIVSFTVPAISAGNYHVFVESSLSGRTNPVLCKMSNSVNFVITAPYSSPTPSPTPIAQPSIKIISPNGGETFKKDGSQIRVYWSTNNVPSSHVLDVFRLRSYPDGQEYNLAYNISNNSKQGYLTIPTSIPVGNYTLEVKTYVDGILVKDASDASFNITDATQSYSGYVSPTPTPTIQPSIKVVSPNGGGSYANIDLGLIVVWTNNFDMVLPRVSLYSPTHGYVTQSNTFVNKFKNGTNYYNTILSKDAIYSGQYKFEVCDMATVSSATGKPLCDMSDDYFTVTTIKASPTVSPSASIKQNSMSAAALDALIKSEVQKYLDSRR